ncbi:MAG: bestrophin family ion channel [Polyangiales bacterium]
MHAGRHYTVKEVLLWTRRETIVFALLSSVPPLLTSCGVAINALPWAPVAVLGVAVAFVTGFKSNAAYGRLWEARQIWGAIVNASRAWAIMVRDFITPKFGDGVHMRLILRHVAWLTALRHQLREPRVWETSGLRHNIEYQKHTFAIPERVTKLEDDLSAFISGTERGAVLAKKNRASALLALQSEDLRRCVDEGRLSEYRHVELMRMLATLYEQQGKCERIKNFPYPRQFATLNLFFVWLFIAVLPFGIVTELQRLGPAWCWLTMPLSLVIAWVFHTMDKIGDASENPFEGGPNDVPITAMTRGIEIDLRDFLNEPTLPEPLKPTGNILM